MPPSDSTRALAAADRSVGCSIIAFAESAEYEKNVMNLGMQVPPRRVKRQPGGSVSPLTLRDG